MVMATAETERAADVRLYEQGTMTIPALTEFTGLGRTFLYAAMDAGKLKYVKAGKRRLVPRQAAVDYLASLGGAGR